MWRFIKKYGWIFGLKIALSFLFFPLTVSAASPFFEQSAYDQGIPRQAGNSNNAAGSFNFIYHSTVSTSTPLHLISLPYYAPTDTASLATTYLSVYVATPTGTYQWVVSGGSYDYYAFASTQPPVYYQGQNITVFQRLAGQSDLTIQPNQDYLFHWEGISQQTSSTLILGLHDTTKATAPASAFEQYLLTFNGTRYEWINSFVIFPAISLYTSNESFGLTGSSYDQISVEKTCDNISGSFQLALCQMFTPEKNSLLQFSDLKDRLSVKPPFGYLTIYSNALKDVATSTTGTIDIASIDSFKDLSFLGTIKTVESIMLYFGLAFWFYNRFRFFHFG